ncbi:MAG: substrate-binding domain-containing protein [Chloroflexi bacterium]|nr:substrate-binding domain-containing protein [Chloroflexota bacterium]MXX80436.1 substrate-binding domain-containing protein [Chloroflexota bacterium]MYB22876.1 substrate-binding domain-containing protein [Chloroflexota bacterium]MYD15965.1 substrate-binding domain-containing protein [Chloroflexota bacterium]MYF22679.1 substrate-binding domain-containing protein [Chloroflexota bacterium]
MGRGSELVRRIERLANEGWLRWAVLAGLVALAMIAAYVCRVDRETALIAGTGALPETDIRVAMITHGGIGDPFWDEVAAGAFAAQREFGIELLYDGDGNVNEQVRLVDNVVALGYDLLIVSLADPDALEDSIRSAVRAGLTVMTINSGEERGREFGAVTHFGQPDGVAGLGAGERLASEGVTKLLCLIHEAGNVGLESRCANAGLAMEAAGGSMQRLFVTGTADRISTTGEIAAVLQADESIDGVLALNSTIAELALDAIASSGSPAKLATFDVSPAILESIEAGDVLFAVDQQAYLQGFLPILYAYIFSLEPTAETHGVLSGMERWAASGRLVTGPGFVDKSNARRFPQLGGE